MVEVYRFLFRAKYSEVNTEEVGRLWRKQNIAAMGWELNTADNGPVDIGSYYEGMRHQAEQNGYLKDFDSAKSTWTAAQAIKPGDIVVIYQDGHFYAAKVEEKDGSVWHHDGADYPVRYKSSIYLHTGKYADIGTAEQFPKTFVNNRMSTINHVIDGKDEVVAAFKYAQKRLLK